MSTGSRRRFLRGGLALAGLGLLSACGLLKAQSQPAPAGPKVHRIGILNNSGPSSGFTEPFLRGLAELGYVEGRDLTIEWRADEGHAERLVRNAAELVALPVDVIVAAGDGRTRAAREATGTIPIVIFSGVDPVGNGLIESLGRPGGSVTGAIEGHPELHGRRLQLLREIAPGISRVTAVDQAAPARSAIYEELEAAARAFGLRLRIVRVSSAEMLEAALAREAGEPADALYVVHSGFMFEQRAKFFDFAARRRLPAMYGNRLYAEAGGLAAYGTDVLHMYYRAASYVDRILKGAKPADLPVELPTKFDFVINLTTARAFGLTISQSVLQQATEVIE